MNPVESITSVFRNYVNFRGRAQRSEFWWFTLFSVIVSVVLAAIASAVSAFNVVEVIYSLAVLLPSLAVTARRLHDTGRTAKWLLIYVVIIAGWIIGIIMLVALFVSDVVSVASDGNDREIRDKLESELGYRVSQSDLREIRRACAEPDDWDLSKDEQEERDAICGIVQGGWTGTIGAFIFLLIWGLVSAAGVITLLIFCAMPGTTGPNKYGPDPLQPYPGSPPSGPGASGSVPPYLPPPAPSAPDSGAESGQRRYCTQCGTQLPTDSRFCTYCGASV